MTALGADTGIGAAVLPGEALKLPADSQRSGVQIDVLPPKTKGFTLAQPKCEGDTPAGAVSPRCNQPDDAQRLVKGQRFDFVVTGGGGINEGGYVARDISALHGDLEGAGQDAVNLEHSSRRQTLGFQPCVEALDVLRGEPVQAMLAKAGDDSVADLRRVGCFQGGSADAAGRMVV